MGYETRAVAEPAALDMGAVDSRGKWVHRVGISVQRQQGKSVDLIVWVAVLASLAGYKVLWTDHNYSTTMEMLERFRKIFGRKPGDRVYGMPAGATGSQTSARRPARSGWRSPPAASSSSPPA